MKYNPADGQPPLLPDGWYDATLAAVEKMSKKSNNPMLVVTATVHYKAQAFLIDIFLVLNTQGGLTRLKRLCQAIDINYDAGEITDSMVSGKGCQVMVKTQTDETGQYWDKNVVAQFAKMGTQQAAPPTDDEIPF